LHASVPPPDLVLPGVAPLADLLRR
jgi:hypothetical protein